MPLEDYEITIGLETHVQLKTETKMFCGCHYVFGSTPNTQVCPVCLALPGALPVPNQAAIELAVRAGLALGCEIVEHTHFERKNYFYPDLPKGYQISQCAVPFAQRGTLTVPRLTADGKPDPDGRTVTVHIHEAHMEEDTGKSFHGSGSANDGRNDRVREEAGESEGGGGTTTLVDLNRAGVPLLEIVTTPSIHDPGDAYAYLLGLKRVLEFLDIGDCEMQEGSLRCDANISLMPKGEKGLGTKTEVKNLNSFKAARDALCYEAHRQAALLDKGIAVEQETRGWRELKADARGLGGETVAQRSKEGAHDYRFFPEPDLPALVLGRDLVDRIRDDLPELPFARERRYVDVLGLGVYDANILCATRAEADFFEATFEAARNKRKMQRAQGVKLAKACADLFKNQVKTTLNEQHIAIDDYAVPPAAIGALARLLADGKLPNQNLRRLYELLVAQPDADPVKLGEESQLFPVAADPKELARMVEQVFGEQPQAVEDARAGKDAAKHRLVGEVMRAGKRRFQFPDVQAAIDDRLKNGG